MINVINGLIRGIKKQSTLKNKILIVSGFMVGALLLIGISFGVTVGVVKLITMCFGLTFKLKYAVGIWLVMWLLNIMRGR